MTTGLLLLRLLIGAILVGHGLRKLDARVGPGPVLTGKYFEHLGFRPGTLFAVIAGVTECVAGVLLALGFLTPLAVAMALGLLANAANQERARGFWAENRGSEYPVVLAVTCLALAFTGPGTASVDHALGLDLAGPAWAVAAIILAALATAPLLLLAQTKPQPVGARR